MSAPQRLDEIEDNIVVSQLILRLAQNELFHCKEHSRLFSPLPSQSTHQKFFLVPCAYFVSINLSKLSQHIVFYPRNQTAKICLRGLTEALQ